MKRDELMKDWARKAADALVGRRIVSVGYLDQSSCKEMMWDRSCIVLVLDSGTRLFPSADDEGNGPGALFTDLEHLPCIPVIG